MNLIRPKIDFGFQSHREIQIMKLQKFSQLLNLRPNYVQTIEHIAAGGSQGSSAYRRVGTWPTSSALSARPVEMKFVRDILYSIGYWLKLKKKVLSIVHSGTRFSRTPGFLHKDFTIGQLVGSANYNTHQPRLSETK